MLVTVYGAPLIVAVMVKSMKLRSSTMKESAVAITVQASTKRSWPTTMIGRRLRRPSLPTAASDSAPHTGPKKEPTFEEVTMRLRKNCLRLWPTMSSTSNGSRYVWISPQLMLCGNQ